MPVKNSVQLCLFQNQYQIAEVPQIEFMKRNRILNSAQILMDSDTVPAVNAATPNLQMLKYYLLC